MYMYVRIYIYVHTYIYACKYIYTLSSNLMYPGPSRIENKFRFAQDIAIWFKSWPCRRKPHRTNTSLPDQDVGANRTLVGLSSNVAIWFKSSPCMLGTLHKSHRTNASLPGRWCKQNACRFIQSCSHLVQVQPMRFGTIAQPHRTNAGLPRPLVQAKRLSSQFQAIAKPFITHTKPGRAQPIPLLGRPLGSCRAVPCRAGPCQAVPCNVAVCRFAAVCLRPRARAHG